LLLALIISMMACTEPPTSPLVAKVSGHGIGIEEFKAQSAFMGLGSEPKNLTRDLRAAVLETLIRRHLVLNAATSEGIRLLPEELNREERFLRRGLREEDFESALIAQGLTYAQWRRLLGEDLLVRKALELILAGRVRVTAAEVQAYYQDHRDQFRRPAQILAQHVVLPTRELAQELLRRVEAGEDLGQVAAAMGFPLAEAGEPTWLSRGHMPEALENKVFALKPGKLAGPLRSTYGFHVLKVLDKRPAGLNNLTQLGPEIQRRLAAEKRQTLAQSWIDDLRRGAEVWLNPNFLAKGQTGESGG